MTSLRTRVAFRAAPYLAALKMRRLRQRVRGLDAVVDLAFDFEYGSDVNVRPIQQRGELRGLLRHAAELQPGVVVEIGTAEGGTLLALTEAAAPDAVVVSVEIPRPLGYHPRRSRLYRAFARDRQRIRLIRADSHDPATPERVRRAAGGAPIDLLMIDGDHHYDGVRRDFEMYAPLVRSGGLIAFHDISPGKEEHVGRDGGVPRLWRELRETRPVVAELVEDPELSGCGIGILRA
jgi:predicted O-methyltransferase YrrM